STSDAEAIIALYRQHPGDPSAWLNPLRGMFALALYDSARDVLILARDRTGEKPLYYTRTADAILFASEIKALLAAPQVHAQSALEGDLLAEYLTFGCIHAPNTAFKGIFALPPAHVITITRGQVSAPHPYWQAPMPADDRPVSEPQLDAAADQVLALLEDAVKGCLLSDVPLGAFLSGGLDSSLIVALMARHTRERVKTFSIGFAGDASYDETRYAQQVADYLGTDHTAFTVEPHALDLLDTLVWHHDQPFGDSSAIPTYLVSQLTRAHVTVALTGDGGDELFAGYERFAAAGFAAQLQPLRPMMQLAAGGLRAFPEGTGYYDPLKRVRRFINGASQAPASAYLDWVRLFSADQIQRLVGSPAPDFSPRYLPNGHFSVNGLLQANLTTYLPDDLLVKTDRSSMAVSLETRAPFLDHRLIELAASLPLNMKLDGRLTKKVLKRAARGLLPDAIIHRRKHGFGVPLGAWLRADMGLIRARLTDSVVMQGGAFNAAAVTALMDEHASGARDHGQRLWTLLTLAAWQGRFIG
ncbi:MAG: asparagine synthase (glutamine-hydrolyzing), partial [Phototrophicaceae bacterium]